jgi:competence protein ComEC
LKHKLLKKVWRAIAASLAAEILVAPLVIYYFHTFPLLFLVANVLALIFMAFVINLGLAILATAWWPAAAKLIGWLTNGLVTGFDYIVSGLQRLNPVSFRFLMLSGYELVLVYAAIAGISVFLMRRQRAALLYGLTAASLLGITICYDQWIIVHQQRLVIYNTGTANHIELISGWHYELLYHDTADRNKAAYTTLPAHTH